MRTHREHYIGGRWTRAESDELIDVVNPYSEKVIARVAAGSVLDATAAILAARKAFHDWACLPVHDRVAVLRRVSEGLRRRRDELVEVTIDELGVPRRDAEASQVDLPIDVLDWICDLALNLEYETRVGSVLILREPLGVVSCITPWNYPLHQVIVKVGAAMAMGCPVVLKPSEVTPLSALILAEITDEADVPAGVFNLVTGTGPVVGEALAQHADVDAVSFTGSTIAGVRVAELAAPGVKKVALELGGKSASIVLPDAEFDKAVRETVSRCFENSGQACSALTRLLVPRAEVNRAEDIAAVAASGYVLGDPRDETTILGPLVSRVQRDRVRQHIDRALDEGARLVVGGSHQPAGLSHGYFVLPTVLSGVVSHMSIARDEVFGPVLAIMAYDSLDEAVAIANRSEYGLSGAVWGKCDDEAIGVARELRTGQVIVNGGDWDFHAPFGGYRKSGLGRESGRYGLEEFLEVKAIRT